MEFITTRETAMLVWAAIAVLCICLWPKTRSSAASIMKALTQKKVVLILLSFSLYCLIIVLYLDTKLPFTARHYWIALLWVFLSGYKSVFVTVSQSEDPSTWRLQDWVLTVFSISALLEILVSLRSFHWLAELVLLPVILIALYLTIKFDNDSTSKQLAVTSHIILSMLGASLLAYSLVSLMISPEAFLNGSYLLEISLPALLSLFCIPFLYALFLIVCYESSLTRLPNYLNDLNLMSYARSSCAISFAWDVESVKDWVNLVLIEEPKTKNSIQNTIGTIYRKTSLRNRVYTSKGDGTWSPTKAQEYLTNLGLTTNKYHSDQYDKSEWRASSTYFLIGDDPIENAIAYYIYGEEFRACKLLLKLNVQVPSKFNEAWPPYREFISQLSLHALSEHTLDLILERLPRAEPFLITTNTHAVSLTKNIWERHRHGGYDMVFTIEANSYIEKE